MSDLEELFCRIDEVLLRERDAIISLDARAVDRLATEKGELFAALRASPAWTEAAWRPRLRDTIERLRRNLVLLVAARDCLRDALVGSGVDLAAVGTSLSVRG